MKKKMLLGFCSCIFISKLIAICPQDIHTSFLLASQGHEIEAREILHKSFSLDASDAGFISEQFVNWVAKHPSEMDEAFNKSAYYVVNKNKRLAKNAITDYFSCGNPEISEFAVSFVTWGTELMQIDEILNNKERKQ